MNTRRTQRETPRSTKFFDGRGHGYNPGLGRQTFIDELIARIDSSTGAIYHRPSSVRRIPIPPRLESLVLTVERPVGVTTPSGGPMERTLGDRGSSMGAGGPKEVYRINGEEVTKEEWFHFLQEFEYHKKRENREERVIMNNEYHHDDHD